MTKAINETNRERCGQNRYAPVRMTSPVDVVDRDVIVGADRGVGGGADT